MKKLVYFAPQYGLVHLCLIKMGWKECHALFVDDEVVIKMEKWFTIEQ